ncbi:MAG: EamA family transporter [Flavobacteriaceae bacterium]|nr:EamA family transporter [Flavobacteriaceae bacterium]
MLGNKSKSILHFHFIVFIFGFTAILGSLISINSFQIVWFRVLIAALTIIVVIKILKKTIQISLSQLLMLMLCGFLISLHWVFFFEAIKVSNVSVTLSILSLGAFVTSFLEPFFYKKKIVKYEVFLGIIVAVGTIIVFKTQFHYLEGIIYALIAVLLSVFFTLINGKIINYLPSLTISFYELASGFLILSFILLVRGELTSEIIKITQDDLLWLLILGTLCTGYAFVISVDVMRHLSPYTLMISINMEPIYGMLLAYLILSDKEQMSSQFYVGFSLIFFSVIINGYLKLRAK